MMSLPFFCILCEQQVFSFIENDSAWPHPLRVGMCSGSKFESLAATNDAPSKVQLPHDQKFAFQGGKGLMNGHWYLKIEHSH